VAVAPEPWTASAPEDLPRWEADVVLTDGGTVHVRPIRPDDAGRIEALHGRLSPESRYLRFFSPMPQLSPSLLSRFVNVDYVDRMALVAVLGTDIVGVARYDVLEPNRSEAEVAFTVDDAHQGRGLGTVLLEHLAAYARDRGIARFVAETLPNNSRMLTVFRSAGFGDERHFEDGVVRVAFPIQPTPTSVELMHERERQAAAASVARLLRPRSVAVVGAGRRRRTIGHEVFRNLLRSGFTGPVYPVNRSAVSVASVRAYPSLAEIPDDVDLAVVAVPASEVPRVVAQCGEKGVTGLVVMSAGFADAGPEGAAAQRGLVELARVHGMRLLGPNSMGVANAHEDVRLNATLARGLPPPGRVGFMSQSGALGVAIFDEARRRGVGVSTFVSAGNKADVSGNDLIQYWDTDPDTDVVLLYLESFGNPRTFARVTRRLSRRKAVVAVKSGRVASGRLVSGSPWMGPVGSDEMVDALFRYTGVIRVETIAQLFDVAELLANQPLPAGRRVGIVASAGGPGVLAADAAEDAGLLVPALGTATQAALRALLGEAAAVANPVTVAGTAHADAYEQAIRLVLADPGVDALIVAFQHPLATPPSEVAAAVRRAAETQEQAPGQGGGPAKPVLANVMAADEALPVLRSAERPVPAFDFPEAAAQALARVAGLAEWRARPEGRVPDFADADHDAARTLVLTALAAHPEGTTLGLTAAIELLGTYRIPVAATRPVASAAEAAEAARALGCPVVVKATSARMGSRTGHLGIRFDLTTPPDAARAWDEVTAELGPAPVGPEGRERVAGVGRADGQDAGIVVQAMVPPGVETVVEVITHATFGPLLSFGTGGPAAQIYADRVLRVLPITDLDAAEVVRAVRGAPLLFGWRGAPPADVDALVDVLLRVSRLAGDVPEITGVTLGPVLVSGSGAVAVDALVEVAPYRPLPELALRRLR